MSDNESIIWYGEGRTTLPWAHNPACWDDKRVMTEYPYNIKMGSMGMDHFYNGPVDWTRKRLGDWVDDGPWTTKILSDGFYFSFKDPNDAMLFKLTWGGQ